MGVRSPDIIDTSNRVKAIVDRYRAELPAKVDIFYSLDQAPWAEQQVTELQGNIFTALALVMVLVVDMSKTEGYDVLVAGLERVGGEIGVEISVRLYSVYEAMHRI